MNIVYACEWEKNRKSTWSGTSYSILSALEKRVNVHEVDLTMNLFEKVILSVFSCRIRNNRVRIDKSCRPLTIFYKQKKLEFLLSEKNAIPKLIIGDFGKVKNGYYYIDLTVGALLYFRKYYPEMARWANLNEIPDEDLKIRNKYQLEILDNARGIFTMSKWLAEYLIAQEGFSKNKIYYVGGYEPKH